MSDLVVMVVIIAGIYFCIISAAFRKIVGCLIVLVILAAVGYYLKDKSDKGRAKSLVRADQLEFLDWRLGPSSYGSSYALTGRIKNNSSHEVTLIKLRVDARDCNDQGHCDTVGDSDESIFADIPAGQVRDINETVGFPYGMRIEGKFEWNYSVTEIDAQ